jgi:hypothetical protein
MAITTRDGLIAAMASATQGNFFKVSSTTVAGRGWAMFRNNGVPIGGSTPSTTGVALDRTTQGALAIPSPSNTTYLLNAQYANVGQNQLVLFDRLVETGGLSSIVTTAQTVNSASLPARNTSGANVQLWAEIYSNLGGTASATVTATYTNSSGVGSRTATLIGGFPGSLTANTSLQLTLQAGDTGVQSVQSFRTQTSSGTAGNFGIVLRQNLCWMTPTLASSTINGATYGYVETAMTIVPDAACVEILMIPGTTTSGLLYGAIRTGQG